MRFAARHQSVFRWGASFLSLFAAVCALAQTTTASFEYMPDYAIGDFRVSMHARRFLEVAWKGRNLLTQGGEIFTRRYQQADLNGSWPVRGPLGFYRIHDTEPEFDIPVQVVQTNGGLTYTWVCDVFTNGYRQVNYAVVQSNQVAITTTLTIRSNAPAEIDFHPVFLPGVETSFSSGTPDTSIPGTTFQLVDTKGMVTSQVYPSNAPGSGWYTNNCRSFSVTVPEGQVRVTILSDNPSLLTTLYALAKWPMYAGSRSGLVGHSALLPGTAPLTLTYQVVLEAGTYPTNAPTGTPAPALADFVKLTPVLSRGNFWVFYSGDHVSGTLQVDNRSSANAKDLTLGWTVRDYVNGIVQRQSTNLSLAASSVTAVPFDYGALARGAYAIEWNVTVSGNPIGYTALRAGVVPNHPVRDTTNALGAGQLFTDSVVQQVELMKWTGVGIAKFRTEIHDERWPYFEPTQGVFVTNPPSLPYAKTSATSGITLLYSGEQFPPKLPSPSWLSSTQINLFVYDTPGSSSAYLPNDISLFDSYVSQWASRFAGVVHYFSVMNEPDATMAPANAAQTIQHVSTSIKAVIPDARIAACDIMQLTDSLTNWMTQVLQLSSNYVDIITYHNYKAGWYKRTSAALFPVIETAGWEADLQKITSLGKQFGKTVWCGEISWIGCPLEMFPYPTFGSQEQDTANIQVRSYLLTKANGINTILQCYSPSLRDPDYEYTIYPERAGDLIGWGWMVKPRAIAHATLSDLLDQATFVQRVNMPTNLYLFCFQRPAGRFAAAWCCQGTAAAVNPFQAGEATFMSIVGQPLSEGTTIALSGEPVYILNGSLSDAEFLQRILTVGLAGDSTLAPAGNLHRVP